MKKVVIFLLLIFSSVMFVSGVKANGCEDHACATCKYEAKFDQDTARCTMEIVELDDGNLNLNKECKYIIGGPGSDITQKYHVSDDQKITAPNFVDDATYKLKCPPKVYFTNEGAGSGVNSYLNHVFSFDPSGKSIELTDQSNNDRTLKAGDTSNGAGLKPISCMYKNYFNVVANGTSVTVEDNSRKVTVPDQNAINAVFVYAPRTLSCPILWVTCFQSHCKIFSNEAEARKDVGSGISLEKITGKKNVLKSEEVKSTYGGEEIDNGCGGLIGDKYFRDFLQDTFDLIKIIGPTIALVLGMVDFLKAAAASDDGEKKKAYKAVKGRIIAAVLIYLLPSLIQFLLTLVPGDSEGTCNIK